MRNAFIVSALILACSLSAAAQTTADGKKKPAESTAQDAKKKPGDPAAPASGPDTTTETFGDWSIVCMRGGGDNRSCEVSTAIVLRNQSAPFARVAILRAGKDDPVRLAALVPVNVTAQTPLRVAFDGGKAELSLPIRNCTPNGCFAEAELGKDALAALRTPAKSPGQLTVVDASGKAAAVGFSLRGLNDAIDAYLK